MLQEIPHTYVGKVYFTRSERNCNINLCITGCIPCIIIVRSIESMSTRKACVKKELEANPTCADAKDAILKFLDSDLMFGNQKSNQKICEDIKSCK